MRARSPRRSVRPHNGFDEAGRFIVTARGQSVILAADLAAVYGVTTKALNQAVKRNLRRFPSGFAFRLLRREAAEIERSRSQFVTLKRGANINVALASPPSPGATRAPG